MDGPVRVGEYNREPFEDLISAGWDLVIVDEAHRLGGSTDQVARFKLGQGLSEASALFPASFRHTPSGQDRCLSSPDVLA